MSLRRAVLPNGVRVICEALPHVRSVGVGLFVAVGSRDESAEEAGISHFLEHLLFKGTERRDARRLAEEIDAVGGHLNAYTTREYTCFYTKVLDEHLGVAVDLLADMLGRPRLGADDVERERQVILEELGMVEDTPEELVQDLFCESIWPGHGLGRPVAGRRASVAGLRREQVHAFHRHHYTGPNVVAALAGHLDADAAIELLARGLAELPSGPARPQRRPPAAVSGHLRRTKRTEQVHVCFGTSAPALGTDGAWPALLLASVLGGGSSSRLFQAIREERGLCYDVEAFHQPQTDSGAFGIALATGPGSVAEAVELAAVEWRRLQREPVPAHELRRHKDQFRAGLWLGLEGSQSRMSRLGRSEVLTGELLSPEEVVARVEAASAGDLLELACRMGDPAEWAAAAVGPGRALLRGVWSWDEATAFRP